MAALPPSFFAIRAFLLGKRMCRRRPAPLSELREQPQGCHHDNKNQGNVESQRCFVLRFLSIELFVRLALPLVFRQFSPFLLCHLVKVLSAETSSSNFFALSKFAYL